jgi:uncharacterized membrane protein
MALEQARDVEEKRAAAAWAVAAAWAEVVAMIKNKDSATPIFLDRCTFCEGETIHENNSIICLECGLVVSIEKHVEAKKYKFLQLRRDLAQVRDIFTNSY